MESKMNWRFLIYSTHGFIAGMLANHNDLGYFLIYSTFGTFIVNGLTEAMIKKNVFGVEKK